MSIKPLSRAAFILLLASTGLAYAAPPAGPSSPSSPSNPAAPSACPAPDFLLAAPPLTPAPIPASTAVCGCGDPICFGQMNFSSCGKHRACVATGTCSSVTTKSCVCVTQDPPP